ncbi:MAG: TonB-dependent receptor [Myxococcota bacterium]|nr:TonB-dependent receptor [Myxococcota bacterium]
MKEERDKDPREKALAVNLNPRHYGTFAEIGAGQEVVRWFFRAGGAAGTISKSISAYDMKVSDAIYGEGARYVCRERLQAMLDREQRLNIERLKEERGDRTAFFTFADTVAAKSYRGSSECHGWMGIKFQAHPRDEDSQVLIHVRMLDHEANQQQEALGIVGVNLIYGAHFLSHEPEQLLESLLDGLSTDRIEIDMIEFSGIQFRHVDNRVMSLRLVQLGLSGAAMFSASGEVLQPSEALRKRPVLIQRGSFRPVTHVNIDMVDSALEHFQEQCAGHAAPLTLMEITMRNLLAEGEVDLSDFLGRAEVLAATGHTVLISDYFRYDRLAGYLQQFTSCPLGLVMGSRSLIELFDEQYYEQVDGGILEAFGRLFKQDMRIYVYPHQKPDTSELMTLSSLEMEPKMRSLFDWLASRGYLEDVEGFREEVLPIYSRDVLRKIRDGDSSWTGMVPEAVAAVIKERGFFGYRKGRQAGR